MKRYPVIVGPLAEADLIELHRWIAQAAGIEVAEAYLERVGNRLATLGEVPQRGTPREAIGPGVRSIPFERRLVIGYRVYDDEVHVERIIDGRRLLDNLL